MSRIEHDFLGGLRRTADRSLLRGLARPNRRALDAERLRCAAFGLYRQQNRARMGLGRSALMTYYPYISITANIFWTTYPLAYWSVRLSP